MDQNLFEQYLSLLNTKERMKEDLSKINLEQLEIEKMLQELVNASENKEIDLGENKLYVLAESNSVNTKGMVKTIETTLPQQFMENFLIATKEATGVPSFNKVKFTSSLKTQLKDEQNINIIALFKEAEEKNTTKKEVYKLVNLENK